ncbi:peptidoglycan DD-metalloendopeptidase family protein [Microbacterium sp. KUDC0406]|uniref:SH3 domain-containing protein n=1 Tax=Microbacterium sp. KUDC0406 TaxID=2909588 RepID=UPI001F3865B8|nr:SH3 domain-containing protein [Microbacterium sp. KUDC0406]UJP10148.1 peptidoglycan DD-metalloendopeptidase family protein [Microbacterium sp. KUDC0406]
MRAAARAIPLDRRVMKLRSRHALAMSTAIALGLAGLSPAAAVAAVPAAARATAPASAAQGAAAGAVPAATVFVTPLAQKSYTVSAWQGPRCMPMPGASTSHGGVDLATKSGSPIYAVAAGVVTATVSGSGSLAGHIDIRHTVGKVTYTTKYLHIWSATTHVKVGQVVKAGQQISTVGTSGNSTGPHLHLELWENQAGGNKQLDPVPWLKSRGVDLAKQATAITAKTAPSTCTYYTTGVVNLRAGASTATAVVASLAAGTMVTAVPGKVSNSFLPVKAGSRSGWIANWLLSPTRPVVTTPKPTPTTAPKPAPTTAPKPAPTTAPKPTPAGSSSSAITYKTTAVLNLRPTASTSKKALLRIPKGKSVGKVLASSGSWRKVTYAGKTGWVHKDYLTKSTVTSVAPKAITYKTTAVLNLRPTASTSKKALLRIPKGKSVGKVLASSGSWRKVTYAGKTGWVHKDYLAGG